MLGPFEIEILRFLENLRYGPLNVIFKYITTLGEGTVIIGVSMFFYFLFDKEFGIKLCYLYSGGHVNNGILKNLFVVQRPFLIDNGVSCVYPTTATGYSFPSGHSTGAATLYPALAKRYKKPWLTIFSIIIILLIGFSRMYLGCHYLSDIVVGIIVGLLWSIVMYDVYNKYGLDKLSIITIAVGFPFFVLFLFSNDPQFADYYSSYAMIIFTYLGVLFERKYADYKVEGSATKRVIRLLIGVGFVAISLLGVGELLKLITFNGTMKCICSFIKYGLMCFLVYGFAPYLFKKLKL